MRYLILAATVLTISAEAVQALPKNCGDIRDSFSKSCTGGTNIFSTKYWQCKTAAWITYGICQVMARQVNDQVAAKLTDACGKDPHSQACEDELDKTVNDAATEFAKEPDFDKQELLNEIKKDVESAMAPLSPKAPSKK